jgi:hypothetical protein
MNLPKNYLVSAIAPLAIIGATCIFTNCSRGRQVSVQKAVRNNQTIEVGMTGDQIRSSWGEPTSINRATTPLGDREVLNYPGNIHAEVDESGHCATIGVPQ